MALSVTRPIHPGAGATAITEGMQWGVGASLLIGPFNLPTAAELSD